MDEFWSRKMRRLALLAVINSVAIPAAASEPPEVTGPRAQALVPLPQSPEATTQAQESLRSLLSRGWESGGRYSVTIQPRSAQKRDAVKPQADSGPVRQMPEATILRPKREPLSLTDSAAEHQQLKPLDGDLKSTSLADLLRKAPSSGIEASTPTAKALPSSVAGTTNTPVVDQPESVEPRPQPAATQADSEPKSSGLAALLKTAPGFPNQAPEPTFKPEQASIARLPEMPVTDQHGLVEQSLETPVLDMRQTELLHDTVKKNGFGLLATDQIELPVREDATEPMTVMKPQPLSSEMIHATRLRGVAQGLLRDAFHSLRRNANYTARKKATAALRSIIAMRDAIDGGNQHSRELEVAMDAIRESRDFGTGIEAVDHEQLKRLVAVHETEVLKETPLSEVSSLGATTAYLEFAREKLVAASGEHHEASYALQLLGQAEKRLKGSQDSHAAAIAITYQRSAVEVDPSNATAQYELGKTYVGQGLARQAQIAFARSVELRPSREAYENLMEAARKLGDIDMVRRCKHALADSSLPSNFPVYQLEPAVFAATHRPQLATPPVQTQHGQTQAAQPRQAKANRPHPKHVSQASKPPQTKPQSSSSDVTAMTRLRSWFSSDQ